MVYPDRIFKLTTLAFILLLILGCNGSNTKKKGLYIYTAKFICGEQFFGGFPQSPDVARMPGNYAVSINVHNPNKDTVRFQKKAVLLEEGRPSGQGPASQTPQPPTDKVTETLGPDWALQMVCLDIQKLFGITANTPISPCKEGFVVFESPKPLDVVVVYTYKNIERAIGHELPQGVGVGASIDVEYIRATEEN